MKKRTESEIMYKNKSIKIPFRETNIIVYGFSILVGIVLYFSLLGYITNFDNYILSVNNYNFEILKLSWLGIGIIAYCIASWVMITKNIFSPYIIFLAFLVVFNFGQCLLWSFGIHSDTELGTQNLFSNYPVPTYPEIIKAQLFACLAIYYFHLGALFCIKPNINITERKVWTSHYFKRAMFLICLTIAFVSVPVTFFRVLKFLMVSLEHGYAAIYYSNLVTQAGISMIVEIFFFPSLVGILIGSNYARKVKISVYFIIALYTILNLLAGERGNWLYIVIVLVWMHHVYINKINLKRFLKLSTGSLLGLYVISAMVSLRHFGLSNIGYQELVEAFDISNFPVFSFIFEMGNSMGIILILLSKGVVWDYSNSFLVAILGMPTTRIPTFLGLDLILIPNWFSQEYLNITWGSGFSLFGEALLMGGIYSAPFIIMLIGFFVATLLFTKRSIDFHHLPLRFFLIATSLNAIIGWSRGSSLEFLRDWFRGSLTLVILIFFFSHFLMKVYPKFNRKV